MIEIIAHRGYSAERPENTIASFDLAVNSGFPLIELDTHLTLDKIPVVMHDSDVDRTTNGTGPINSLTLEEIKKLDAGSWFDVAYSNQQVPTLEEILIRYKNRAHIFIEIKSNEEALLETVGELLIEQGWIDPLEKQTYTEIPVPGVSLISFLPDQIVRAKEIIPGAAMHGFLMIEPSNDAIEFCLDNQIKGFLPYIGMMQQEIVNKAIGNQLFVGAWGIESEGDIERASSLGIHGITVNWPAIARQRLGYA